MVRAFPAIYSLVIVFSLSGQLPTLAAETGTAADLTPNGVPQTPRHHNFPLRTPEVSPKVSPHLSRKAPAGRVYSGVPVSVKTFHNNRMRTGWNPRETDLTPATVASGNFGLLQTLYVDGNVMAQPLIISGILMPDGIVHNVLIVATGHNTVYAYDAETYAALWQVNLGPSQTSFDVGCTDVTPEYGISSTPVIIRTGVGTATLFVVAATEPARYSFHTQLHALNLATGEDLLPPREIAPRARLADGKLITYDPQSEYNRASLAWANNSLYVALGAHCDLKLSTTTGWLLRYSRNLVLLHAFNTIQRSASLEMAGIWMGGSAPAVDETGNIFVVTGNGSYNPQTGASNYGQSVLSLSRDLKTVNGTFTPANYTTLNYEDKDFGAGGIMLLPLTIGQGAPPMAVAMGKDPVLYLLNRNKLGGLQRRGVAPLRALRQPVGGVWGAPAYYHGPTGIRVYYQMDRDVLRGFAVDPVAGSLTDVVDGTSNAGFGGSMPIVSSNGQKANTAIVWLIRRGSTLQLEAYDALRLGAPIFTADAGSWSNSFGNAYVSPLAANGRVYVPGYKTVTVFGLRE
jgi:hypothetical protein